VTSRPMSGRTFDDVLGPADGRYFGSGYRRTRYHLPGLRSGDEPEVLSGAARVQYPEDWSRKEGVARVAHLSTADALVLAAHAVQVALGRTLGLVAAEVRSAWFMELSVRTGARPVTDLQAVPVSCRRTTTTADGRQTDFLVKVGTFTVAAQVCHPEARHPRPPQRGRPSEPTLYTHGFRESVHAGSVLSADTSVQRLDCSAEVGALPAQAGIESGTGCGATLLDCLVFAGQMLQMLVCLVDGTTRDGSGNLWLRTITFTTVNPVRPGHSRPRMWIPERQDVQRGDDVLHSLTVRCENMFGTTLTGKAAYTDRPG
jgi:hypothetical protein